MRTRHTFEPSELVIEAGKGKQCGYQAKQKLERSIEAHRSGCLYSNCASSIGDGLIDRFTRSCTQTEGEQSPSGASPTAHLYLFYLHEGMHRSDVPVGGIGVSTSGTRSAMERYLLKAL